MFDVGNFLNSDRRWAAIRGDAVSWLRRIPDGTVDAFVSDPPYGIDLCLRWSAVPKAIAGDGKLEARKLWKQFVPEAWRIAKPDTAHLFFGSWKSPWIPVVLGRYFTVKGCITWVKPQWGLGFYLRPRWELAYYCHKGKPPRPQKADHDVWEHSRDGRLRHPCQKPIELLRRGVRLCAAPGALICDPFAGIFSTGVAALQENCRFLGFEIDPKHHKLGRQRLNAEHRIA